MMKRSQVHSVFAILALTATTLIGVQQFQKHRLDSLADAISEIPESMESLEEIDSDIRSNPHPAIQMALGSALAKSDNLAEAERILNPLANNPDDLETSTNAHYNLANAYLRSALNMGSQISSSSLPLVELAKQRYRDLLKDAPDHWQARYNLERALTMAPEGTDREDDERIEPVKSVNVIVPGFEKKDLP